MGLTITYSTNQLGYYWKHLIILKSWEQKIIIQNGLFSDIKRLKFSFTCRTLFLKLSFTVLTYLTFKKLFFYELSAHHMKSAKANAAQVQNPRSQALKAIIIMIIQRSILLLNHNLILISLLYFTNANIIEHDVVSLR